MTRTKRLRQQGLFGPVEQAPVARDDGIILAEFNGQTVRMLLIDGEPWWVAADVCRCLELGNVSQAVNGNEKSGALGLDEDEKGVWNLDTPSGTQQMLVINEFGLYTLIFKSRVQEAKTFRRWITHEVIPSIRRTGRYESKSGRLPKLARKCRTKDAHVLIARTDQVGVNKAINRRLADDGNSPRGFADYHNAAYKAQFGRTASELRTDLGLPYYASPLDRMGTLPLCHSFHAKMLAERIIGDRAKQQGKALTIDEQDTILQEVVQSIRDADFSRLGFGYGYGLVDDRSRGMVLDVIQRQLPAASV